MSYDTTNPADKDAEIERLKALITELCDALDGIWGPGGWDLKKRAREATR